MSKCGTACRSALRYGCAGRSNSAAIGPLLHHASLVEDDDFLREIGDDAEIVRDDEHGHPELRLQFLDEGEDLRLDRHVERRGRLVGDEQRRPADERHRDHRPLPQAAGELERIALERARRVRESRRAAACPRSAPCLPCGRRDDGGTAVRSPGRRSCAAATATPSAPGRSSRCDGRGSGAGRCRRASASTMSRGGLFEPGAAKRILPDVMCAGLRQDAHHRLRRHGLARSGFADERNGRSGTNAERDPIERGHHRAAIVELDGKVLNVDQVCQTSLPQRPILRGRAAAPRSDQPALYPYRMPVLGGAVESPRASSPQQSGTPAPDARSP